LLVFCFVQCQVVIYDAQLIIRESHSKTSLNGEIAHTTTSAVNQDRPNVICGGAPASAAAADDDGLKFINAVDRTKLFYRPPYFTYFGSGKLNANTVE